MTAAQQRLVDVIRQHGTCAEYWPVVNDWARGPVTDSLALYNINRTVAAVLRSGVVTLDDDGLFHLAAAQEDR